MDYLIEYIIFLAKVVTIVVALLIVLTSIFSNIGKGKEKGRLQIKNINDKYQNMTKELNKAMLKKHELKKLLKSEKKSDKSEKKAEKKKAKQRRRIFVLEFNGDIKATPVKSLREEISAILGVATKKDEVLLKLESPGGLVHAYGLAASQLQRLPAHNIPLTVAIDKVAASGGYMMACVADKILSAPFAVVGSIGVVAQLPNFNKVLKKNDIQFEQITAGEYKRTLTVFGENTPEKRKKFQEDVDQTHVLFKNFIKDNREKIDIDKVATGEHWYGTRALDLQLVDSIRTSDDYLLEAARTTDIYQVTYTHKKSFSEKVSDSMTKMMARWTLAWKEQDIRHYL